MKNNIATLIVIVMLAVFALPAKAQFNQYHGAVAPQASFQSTSTMVGTGSAYSSNPMLNSNGTAVYNGTSYGPHKAKMEDDPFGGETINDVTKPTQPGTPIGDAVLPLMLCALAYLIFRTRKRAKDERANS